MKSIGQSDLSAIITRRPGLIIGPSAINEPEVFTNLATHLAEFFQVNRGSTYLEVADTALANGVQENQIREEIRKYVSAQPVSANSSLLAKIRWRALLSACLETSFESAFQQAMDRSLFRRTVTAVQELDQPIPEPTIPSFKLLGISSQPTFVASTSDYTLKRPHWRSAFRQFADMVHNAPIICLGMNDVRWVLYDLLAELISVKATTPSSLLFLANDPVIEDPKLTRILGTRVRHFKIDAGLSDIVKAVSDIEKASYTLSLPFVDDKDTLATLIQYNDIVEVLNLHLTTPLQINERNALNELLFSSSVHRWDPYVHELDFPRTIEKQLKDAILEACQKPVSEIETSVFALLGGAAAGKTIILKRVAFDIAKLGYLVLWFKPCWSQSENLCQDLFREVARCSIAKEKPILVIVDDPPRLGTLGLSEIVQCMESAGVKGIILEAIRLSDWTTKDQQDLAPTGLPLEQFSLNDHLDEAEWKNLPKFLAIWGVAVSEQKAARDLASKSGRNSRDWLSVLYWAVPNTKITISESIRDEYFRLGNAYAITRVVLRNALKGPQVLQKAYEMAAVAEKYFSPIPIEILVSALGVEYSVWADAIDNEGPAWGILCDEKTPDEESIAYRTRNSVVCDLILEIVNGGVVSSAGETNVLEALMRSCTGTRQVYRNFCLKILVNNDHLDRLDFENGLRLYEAALTALPIPDKTIMHHKGLWIKNIGRDPLAAYQTLKEALAIKPLPYGAVELDEHIHTSSAATVLDGIVQRKVDPNEGTKIALEHISKARNVSFFNPNAVHVHAGLVVKLLVANRSLSTGDVCALINRAAADVDRALLVLDRVGSPGSQRDRNSVVMLKQVKENLLTAITSLDELKSEAEKLWLEKKNQEGFVLVGRRLFSAALEQNQGRRYKQVSDYLEEKTKLIKDAGETVSPGMIEVHLHLLYQWQVKNRIIATTDTPINWKAIFELAEALLASGELRENPFYLYIAALSYANLNKWKEASAIFTKLRQGKLPKDQLFAPRDFLLNATGGLRRIQGKVREGPGNRYLYSDEMECDILLNRIGNWPRDGGIAHAYVQFSFAGPLGVENV